MEYAVETQHLVKRFPKPRPYLEWLRHPLKGEQVTALAGVDLSIEHGEVFGLLGSNGAGKTTLIKILCSLLFPTEGSARVAGYDVVREGAAVRRSIGYVVSDERSFHWRLSGRQNLLFFATLNNLFGKEAALRVGEVVELVGLERDVDRLFMYYSTGTKQKMSIARGLLTNPPILMLDEPTRSLDLATARSLRKFILGGLAGQGRTVLIATHNMEEASELCGRVAVIDRGRLRACGTPTAIAQAAKLPSRRLILEVEGWNGELTTRLRQIRAVGIIREKAGEKAGSVRLEIEPRNGVLATADVIRAVVLSDGRILSCSEETPSLGDLVLRITGEEA